MSKQLITADKARQRRKSYVVNKCNRLTKENSRLVNKALACIANKIHSKSLHSHETFFNDYDYFNDIKNSNDLLNNVLWYLQKAGYGIDVIELVDYKQITIRW